MTNRTILKDEVITNTLLKEYEDFAKMRQLHTRPFNQFNSAFDGKLRSLQEYIEYSFAKLNQFIEIPEDSEEYEIHLALPNIRNKLMAILARLSAQRMKIEIHPQNADQENDRIISMVMDHLMTWADEVSEHEVAHFNWMFETVLKGTGILCEDYYRYTREVPDIKIYNPQTGKSEWKKKKIIEEGLKSFVVPLEEFYIWNIREPKIEKQHKIVWMTITDYENFQQTFKNYPKVKEVLKGAEIKEEVFFKEHLEQLSDMGVQIMRIFNQTDNTFKIIANNIELTEENNPNPFHHGKAPFARAIYEPIQTDFFYGKNLPDKLGNLSDAINQLFADLFNRNQMILKAPLMAKWGTTMQDTVYRPDSVFWYEGEKPERMEIGGNSQDTDRLFNILQDQLNLSSVSPVNQGQVGSGSTAREVLLAQENANELMNMFLRFMEWGEKERAPLRLSNIIQFLLKSDIVDKVVGRDGQELGRIFFQHKTTLQNGKVGTREIRIKPQKHITPPEVLVKEQLEEKEIYEISLELIKSLKYYIRIIPNSSLKISKALQKALDQEYTITMMQAFPDLVNRRALAEDLTENFDKNPSRLLLDEASQPTSLEDQMTQFMGGKETSNQLLAPVRQKEQSLALNNQL